MAEQATHESWVTYPDRIVRQHVRPRAALYTPESDCPVDVDYLNARRTTNGQYMDGTSFEHADEWTGKHAHRMMAKKWAGETIFWSRLPEGCSSRSLKRAAKRARGKKNTTSALCPIGLGGTNSNDGTRVEQGLGSVGRGAKMPVVFAVKMTIL